MSWSSQTSSPSISPLPHAAPPVVSSVVVPSALVVAPPLVSSTVAEDVGVVFVSPESSKVALTVALVVPASVVLPSVPPTPLSSLGLKQPTSPQRQIKTPRDIHR